MNGKNRVLWCLGLGLLCGAAQAANSTPEITGFVLPSGRLGCLYVGANADLGTSEHLRCDVYSPTFKAPRLKECPLAQGDSLVITATGKPNWFCHGDTVVAPVSADNPLLPYGKTWQHAGFRCTASQMGVNCTNKVGHGFRLARGAYQLF